VLQCDDASHDFSLAAAAGGMMMIVSSDAAVCYNCSSVTDEWCSLNASRVDGRCTARTCFETYDANKPGS